jgi:transcriptional regulator with XRE-family HTH domain
VARKGITVGLDWLYERMEVLGLSTLEEAAVRCGMNRGTLYRYFNFETRPSIDVLPRLCKGLEASPLEVLRALGIQVH